MEDGLVLLVRLSLKEQSILVLILVVMEDGLVLKVNLRVQNVRTCLNPCCNGRWSRTAMPQVSNSNSLMS